MIDYMVVVHRIIRILMLMQSPVGKHPSGEHLTLVVNGATQRLTIYNKGAYKNATNMSTSG